MAYPPFITRRGTTTATIVTPPSTPLRLSPTTAYLAAAPITPTSISPIPVEVNVNEMEAVLNLRQLGADADAEACCADDKLMQVSSMNEL